MNIKFIILFFIFDIIESKNIDNFNIVNKCIKKSLENINLDLLIKNSTYCKNNDLIEDIKNEFFIINCIHNNKIYNDYLNKKYNCIIENGYNFSNKLYIVLMMIILLINILLSIF